MNMPYHKDLLAQIKNLPNEPGVYYFFSDEIKSPLYIGKSIKIRERVKSHLYHSKVSARESKLMQRVTRIDYKLTAGELGALLLESREIKTHKPLYNRRLRKVKDIFFVSINKNQSLWTVDISSASVMNFDAKEEYFGTFASKKNAESFIIELAKAHRLCLKVLNIEKTLRPCFNFQLKKCNGVCCGKEPASLHNQRLYQSLAEHKLCSWPYKGVILIKEASLTSKKEDIHYIDRWRYLYSVSNISKENELHNCFSQQENVSYVAHFL